MLTPTAVLSPLLAYLLLSYTAVWYTLLVLFVTLLLLGESSGPFCQRWGPAEREPRRWWTLAVSFGGLPIALALYFSPSSYLAVLLGVPCLGMGVATLASWKQVAAG